MVAEPERDSGLQLLTLLLLANGGGEIAERMGGFEFEAMVEDLLRDVERRVTDRDFRYYKGPPVEILLHEVRRVLLNPYYLRRGSYRTLSSEDRYDGSLLAKFLDKLEEIESDVEDSREALNQLEEHASGQLSELSKSIVKIEDAQRSSNWSLSLGASFASMRTLRTAPVRIYTKQELSAKKQAELLEALESVLNEYGFAVDLDIPVEISSFWKRFWVKTKSIATQKEVEDRFIKLERALESRHIDKPQAEANKMNADAFSTMMKALENEGDVCAQIGNILLVKHTPISDGSGKSRVMVRTLSPLEMHAIEQNQQLLKDPAAIIMQLESLNATGGEASGRERQRKEALESKDWPL
jgi:hypothetical protein